jgi:hypothetical protein
VEAFVAYFKVLSEQSSGKPEKNNPNLSLLVENEPHNLLKQEY